MPCEVDSAGTQIGQEYWLNASFRHVRINTNFRHVKTYRFKWDQNQRIQVQYFRLDCGGASDPDIFMKRDGISEGHEYRGAPSRAGKNNCAVQENKWFPADIEK